ncbi:hypothetical protein DES52_11670 [Deinococcus yavapaiensis KR-236]|uniref:Uncharacterized protein n=1 Tax=Deinococcus yavapaiensis KR-236 TaxID=694435 RepID=A0A318S5B2_9DEIO|nr:hypothetical protein DES52_11670 [Deinococcus yavapaiensis KR-236]
MVKFTRRGLSSLHKTFELSLTEWPSQSDVSQEQQDTKFESIEVTELQRQRGPKYQRLTLQEARLYEDQYDVLTRLARTLTKARRSEKGSGASERITENTLIRGAIDLLLARAPELRCADEEELRRSVGRPPRSDSCVSTGSFR